MQSNRNFCSNGYGSLEMWPLWLSNWIFKLYLILINLNLQNPMWLNATILSSAALQNKIKLSQDTQNISEKFTLFFYQLSDYNGFAGF